MEAIRSGTDAKCAAPQRLVGQLAEPAFDLVQPRRGGRGEMQLEARVLGQPGLHGGVLGE